MKRLEEIIREIGYPDRDAAADSRAKWNRIAKPLGSLGFFEDAVIRIAALKGSAEFSVRRRSLTVFCADHGVVAQGVTQCGSEVTAHVAAALAEGRSTANALARDINCDVIPVDMGIRGFPGHPGVLDCRVRDGTGDISREPAMSREECELAVIRGADLAGSLASEGCDLLAVGEMGIGNTTPGAALASALLGLESDGLVGRGAGLDREGLERKRRAVRNALRRSKALPEDTIGLMSELGGLEIAGMCGAFLGAARCRIPAIADGMISCIAALCAVRLCPRTEMAILPSHVSAEPAGECLLDALGAEAPIRAGMRLGEGSGALMLIPLLDMAVGLYGSGQSFEGLGIEPYRPQD